MDGLHLNIPDVAGEIEKVGMSCFQERVIANLGIFVNGTYASIQWSSRWTNHFYHCIANGGYTDNCEDEPSHG